MSQPQPRRETDIAETLQSLLVAFTLALAFRGFVIEGFVIPTGSMAPTLLGQHARTHSEVTGYQYAFDGSESLLIRDVGRNGAPTWRYRSASTTWRSRSAKSTASQPSGSISP